MDLVEVVPANHVVLMCLMSQHHAQGAVLVLWPQHEVISGHRLCCHEAMKVFDGADPLCLSAVNHYRTSGFFIADV